MQTYHILSQIKILKKYSFKFLFIAFLGIHIPLFGLIVYLILGDTDNIDPLTLLLIILTLTLVATGITFLILNSLLKPILLAKNF